MDHIQGPERVVIELSRLGYISHVCKYQEYEQSTIMSLEAEKANAESYLTALSQWVANDVDHNVRPLDCHGTFSQNGLVLLQHMFLCHEYKSLCHKRNSSPTAVYVCSGHCKEQRHNKYLSMFF